MRLLSRIIARVSSLGCIVDYFEAGYCSENSVQGKVPTREAIPGTLLGTRRYRHYVERVPTHGPRLGIFSAFDAR